MGEQPRTTCGPAAGIPDEVAGRHQTGALSRGGDPYIYSEVAEIGGAPAGTSLSLLVVVHLQLQVLLLPRMSSKSFTNLHMRQQPQWKNHC